MTTIKDVAVAAGVSIATVSNYINRTKPVSAHTERKIKEAIERLNYTQNLSAKSLKSNQYNDVGVILPNLNDSYYAQIFQGIEHAFQNTQYFLNLSFSYDIADVEQNVVHGLLKKNICGLILITCQPDNWHFYYDHFSSHDKPLVLVDRLINNLDAIFVSFDNHNTLFRITKALLAQGKHNIYLFTGPRRFYCENECVRGYEEAYQSMKLPISSGRIITASLNKEDAFRQTVRVLRDDRPQAIITTSESSAMGIIEGLTLLGYRPDDIPVITLGEEHWNQFTHSFASVSTVRPAMQMGGEAAKLLMQQMQSPKTFEKQHVLLKDRAQDQPTKLMSPDVSVARVNGRKDTLSILMPENPQVDTIRSILPHFENACGINATLDIVPHRYLFEKIMSEYAEPDGRQSDVFMYDIPWLYELAATGVLADISEYINDSSFHADIYLPNCLKYFSEFEGKYFGLPFMYAPQILYYRKDLFDHPALRVEYEKKYHSRLQPPRTWTEFNAISEFFTHCDSPENLVNYGTSIPTAYKECLVPEIYMRLWSHGAKVFDQNNRVTFDTPQTLKAYVNYKGTLKSAKPDFLTATDVSVVSDFINGDTAMLITYPSFLTDIVDLRRSSLTGSIGYSHIPGRTPILGGWSFGINANSANKEAAFKFLNWACTETNANYFALLGGQPAIAQLFTNDELVKLYPWLPLYLSVYKYTKPLIPPYQKKGAIISQDKIDSALFEEAIHLILDETDVSEAIQNTQSRLETIFAEYIK